MMCLTFCGSKLNGESAAIFDRINTFYNEFVYKVDNAEPCYRYLLDSLREPVNTDLYELASPTPGPERTSQSSALVGTFSAMLPNSIEVKELNAQVQRSNTQVTHLNAGVEHLKKRLAEKESALARKEAQVNDLTRRLAERVGAMNSSWSWVRQGSTIRARAVTGQVPVAHAAMSCYSRSLIWCNLTMIGS